MFQEQLIVGVATFNKVKPSLCFFVCYLSALVMVGHTHAPFVRTVNGTRVTNVGSVSNPFPPDLRASYVILEGGEHGCQIEFRRADYDRQQVIENVRTLRHPGGEYIIKHMRGEVVPDWLTEWQQQQERR